MKTFEMCTPVASYHSPVPFVKCSHLFDSVNGGALDCPLSGVLQTAEFCCFPIFVWILIGLTTQQYELLPNRKVFDVMSEAWKVQMWSIFGFRSSFSSEGCSPVLTLWDTILKSYPKSWPPSAERTSLIQCFHQLASLHTHTFASTPFATPDHFWILCK